MSYNEAKILFAELVEEGGLHFASGITYNVRAEKLEKNQKADAPDICSLDEYREKLRNSLRSDDDDEAVCVDDDDEEDDELDKAFEDFEDEAYEKLLEALREEEEDDDDGESDEDDEQEAFNRLGNFGKLHNLKRIFNDCMSRQIKNEDAGGMSCNVIAIGGEQFKLEYDDGLLQIIYEDFAPADCISAIRADSIIEEYKNLHYKAGAVVATVEDTANSLDALLELYAAVVRINHGE
ncbi:MAG: hypothetical protein K2I17_05995 [Clostridia bacterium]|nr:hypothetical protein [Clostridia bacterium]